MSGTVNRERLHPGRQTIDRADELRLPDIEPDGTRFIGPLASWAIEPAIIRREPGRTHTHTLALNGTKRARCAYVSGHAQKCGGTNCAQLRSHSVRKPLSGGD